VRLPLIATSTASRQVVVARVKIDGRTVASQTLGRRVRSGVALPFDVVLSTRPARNTNAHDGRLVAQVVRDSEVEVDVAFGPTTRQDGADVFRRRFDVSRTGSRLSVQTPGLQYHRFDVGHVVWVRQNVVDHLAER
jgi:hypothetical protein